MNLEQSKYKLIESLSYRIADKRIVAAMAMVPRERFIPLEFINSAYDDHPLSIGFNQTISQPYIVALMTEALDLHNADLVLEIGTGSGYQTAILAELAKHVVSVERIPQLLESAKNILINELKYQNIELHVADKKLGWLEGQPYDAIIVTAAAPKIPKILVNQLKTNGRLVIPIGSKWEQDLIKLTKLDNYNNIENLGGCRFVPLIGEDSWTED